MAHIPVFLNETLQYLDPKPGDNFIDCTIGEGGHALAILKMTAPNGKVLGIDRDAGMVERLLALHSFSEVGKTGDGLLVHHGNFSEIGEIARSYNFTPINGILFDFGLSSWQLEESGAGFSFQNIEPLDMRFDRTRNAPTAASIVNSWPQEAISRVLHELGEERYARRIAKEIVASRKNQRIETTDQLVAIISKAVPRKQKGIHFATRTFQALRIAVNSELENIKKGLEEAINLLSPGGRIAAISFHSLEDRRVKQAFVEGSSSGLLKVITKKPITPSPGEVKENPRARSAKLRVAEKV